MSDTKHGWVTPRADGARARCGGPGICPTCNTEAMHEKMLTGVFGAPAGAGAAGAPVADGRALPPLPPLPPLPSPALRMMALAGGDKIDEYWVAPQMREYARAALASAPVAGEAQQLKVEHDRGFSRGWDLGHQHGSDLGFSGGVCVALQVITGHDAATIWREVVQACDLKKMLDYAANVEPDEWELAGFKQYARAELNERKPRKRSVPAAPQASEAVRWFGIDLDAAAKAMTEFTGYPWEHLPEPGRVAMRKHAQSVIDAALSAQPGAQYHLDGRPTEPDNGGPVIKPEGM
ncbi:hypothetical protein LMG26854_03355 [Achromobacter aegrifaciens]|uniref:hypothetical protein n=1 Tax=Achromobacter aegrifaciens TaxID=1287736 RepID=UPI00146530F6|nr:hypothetical protein [Achromobacter aegrifaciens]CAB3858724.1 hypothetical protein LMG26854_03355 [Achromobacter aegrifaciens]